MRRLGAELRSSGWLVGCLCCRLFDYQLDGSLCCCPGIAVAVPLFPFFSFPIIFIFEIYLLEFLHPNTTSKNPPTSSSLGVFSRLHATCSSGITSTESAPQMVRLNRAWPQQLRCLMKEDICMVHGERGLENRIEGGSSSWEGWRGWISEIFKSGGSQA